MRDSPVLKLQTNTVMLRATEAGGSLYFSRHELAEPEPA